MTLSSCKRPISTVIFHTDMGEMAVEILPNLPDQAATQLDQLLASRPDSLSVAKVLQNGYIQLGLQPTGANTLPGQTQPALSGAFVLCAGQYYIVQGRTQTDATLDKWEQTNGRKIPAAVRDQYKKKGGALPLEGRCFVLGNLVSGNATLDRLAALPSDADGRPLRVVTVRVKTVR